LKIVLVAEPICSQRILACRYIPETETAVFMGNGGTVYLLYKNTCPPDRLIRFCIGYYTINPTSAVLFRICGS
jgi:hypothetical protein